jgi:hypothetical protein
MWSTCLARCLPFHRLLLPMRALWICLWAKISLFVGRKYSCQCTYRGWMDRQGDFMGGLVACGLFAQAYRFGVVYEGRNKTSRDDIWGVFAMYCVVVRMCYFLCYSHFCPYPFRYIVPLRLQFSTFALVQWFSSCLVPRSGLV